MQVLLARLALVASILTLWELVSGPLVPELFLSRPSEILARLKEWTLSGDLFFHARITIVEALLGFVAGALVGVVVGLLLGRFAFAAKVLDPFITAFYSLPKLALAPLFILWLGIDLAMKVTLTAAIVFFLVFLNTYSGVRNVSREQIAVLRLMGATERHLMQKVVLPSAMTWVFAGLRLSVPYAVTGAVVGEIIASNKGLGYLLQSSAGQFDTAGVFAAIFAIMALALLINVVVKGIEARLMPWRSAEGEREVTV